MINPLTAPVQVAIFPPRVVWYAPDGFPDVQTDAELVDWENGIVTVFTGMGYETIQAEQIKRIVSVYSAETTELLDMEGEDYDAQEKS